MNLRKKDKVFLITAAIILVAAVIFVFAGARSSGPEITYHEFSIPVTYEEYGEVKTQTVTYYGHYWVEDGTFHGYYEDSGLSDTVNMKEVDGNPIWWLRFEPEAGYLMGDPAYADYYAGGMPQATIGYFDEEWNEHNDVTEAAPHGIRLIGCEMPTPIENSIVDKGVKLDHLDIGVLTLLAFVILVLGNILVKKEEDVVYQGRDKAARILNFVIGFLTLPILFLLGDEWELVVGHPVYSIIAAMMAPVTVLGISASVLLRRKGKSQTGMAVQFAGLLLFLFLITANVLLAFEETLLFLIAGVAVGIWILVKAKKLEAAAPKKLDRVAVVTNAILIPVYLILSLLMMFMSLITRANYGAAPVQEMLGQILAYVIAATPIYCGIALGMSVNLRRKGKSLAGFLVQFAGFVGFLLFLLIDLLPWISITIN